MKIKRSFLCELCAKRIKDYGFVCYDLVETVCYASLHKGICVYHENLSGDCIKSAVKFLERKGILLTTDIEDENVIIRPNMRKGKYFSDTRVFCWCKGEKKL